MQKFFDNRLDCNTEVINQWKLIMTNDEIKQCVRTFADVINKVFKDKNIVLTCILKGAVYFFVDLSRMLTIPYSCYFIEASSYHNNQTQSKCLQILNSIEPSKFVDKHVILLDELFDSGHTIEQVAKAIHEKAGVPMDKIFPVTLFKKKKATEKTNDKETTKTNFKLGLH